MLTVKEFKEILEECNDEDCICLEYAGSIIELEHGDRIKDLNARDIEINNKYVTILF